MKSSSSNFIDYVKIFCTSGKGGSGSSHFSKSKIKLNGKPDGGDGGHGGSIIVEGDRNKWTLLHLKYTKHISAKNGSNGSRNLKYGADGLDYTIKIPLGTVIKDFETGEKICEITEHGETKVILKGGKGGKGNAFFKSSTNRSPKFAQQGIEGIEKWIIIELKLLADVGLVGFPNAGKSTLLSVLSAAKPKIANYPFTTLTPNLGIVGYKQDLSFTMADIPGIIEGASEGKGLGIRFLRHIERNAILLFMISCESKDINKEFKILMKELNKFNEELLHKKIILAISKADLIDNELKSEIEKELKVKCNYCFISSVSNTGLENVKNMIWKELKNAKHN